MKNKKTKIIGLTGGFASGKTTALKEFEKLGIKTISSDGISKKVFYRTGVLKRIKKYFKTMDRKKIAEIVFSDVKKRRGLEKILHPEIIGELKKQLASAGRRLPAVVVDVPLLYEAHLEKMFDKIITVYCKKNQQAGRLMKRDGITKTEALRRISSQIPLSKKTKSADFIIKNTGLRKKIKGQVKKMLDKLI